MFNNVAYVMASGNDSAGVVGNPSKPFLTLSAAITALSSEGGILKIGIGNFITPSQSLLSSKPLTIIGSGKPYPNWIVQQLANNAIAFTTPTKLEGGTILKGEVAFLNVSKAPKIYNLGVDVGSDYVTAGGSAGNGIAFYQSNSDEDSTINLTPYPLAFGLEIRNIITLCQNPDSQFHGLVLQGAFSPFVQDVTTVHGTHGYAIKTTAGKFNNLMAVNHGGNGIIIKSNNYSNANKNIIDGFSTYGCANGVTIENKNSIVFKDLLLSNGFIEGGTIGVRTYDDYGNGFEALSLSNIRVRNATTSFSLSGHSKSAARNCWNGNTLFEFQN